MSEVTEAREVIVWTDADRCEELSQLLDVMGAAVRPIGIGGPRASATDDLAKKLGCVCEDDLRKLIVEQPADCLLMMTWQGATLEDLTTAATQNTRVLTLDPVAQDFDGLRELEDVLPVVHFVPSFIQSPGSLRAADPTEALGDRRVMQFQSLGPATSATLYARLWDAWSTLLQFAELPQAIDAALTSDDDETPGDLANLCGRLTAHGRFANKGSGVLHLSDTGGRPSRSLRVVGDEADLCIAADAYTLHKTDGELIDDAHHDGPTTWADLIAHQWRRILDRPATPVNTAALRDTLACCLATLLSARTGEAESPQNILQMNA